MGPRRALTHEDVGGPGIVATGILATSPDDGVVAVDAHRDTEAVAVFGIVGGELGLLGPRRALTHEDVGSPEIVAAGAFEPRPDEGIITADGYRDPELVSGGSIIGDELDLLSLER